MPIVRGAEGEHVKIYGLNELVRALKQISDEDPDGINQLKAINYKVAGYVKQKATSKAAAQGALALKAMHHMAISQTAARAALREQIIAAHDASGTKREGFYAFGGVEFGAYQNKRRLVKERALRSTNGGGTRRQVKASRATMIHDNEDIGKVARRVESQFVDKTGRTVGRGEVYEKQRVQLKRRENGGIYAVRGWNQFKPWTGNGHTAGHFFFPTVRAEFPHIQDMYWRELEHLIFKVWHDKGNVR